MNFNDVFKEKRVDFKQSTALDKKLTFIVGKIVKYRKKH